MEIEEEASLRVYRRLSLDASKLHESNVTTPTFHLIHGKLWAKYNYTGLSLAELSQRYEIDEAFLGRVWGSITSAVAAFERIVGRRHGKVNAKNIFVDAFSEKAILGAHLSTLDPDGEGDVPALMGALQKLADDHGLPSIMPRPMTAMPNRSCGNKSISCANPLPGSPPST